MELGPVLQQPFSSLGQSGVVHSAPVSSTISNVSVPQMHSVPPQCQQNIYAPAPQYMTAPKIPVVDVQEKSFLAIQKQPRPLYKNEHSGPTSNKILAAKKKSESPLMESHWVTGQISKDENPKKDDSAQTLEKKKETPQTSNNTKPLKKTFLKVVSSKPTPPPSPPKSHSKDLVVDSEEQKTSETKTPVSSQRPVQKEQVSKTDSNGWKKVGAKKVKSSQHTSKVKSSTASKYPNAPFTDCLRYNHTKARAAWIIGSKGKNIRDCVSQTQYQVRGWYRAELNNGVIDLYSSCEEGLPIFREFLEEIVQLSEFRSDLD